MSSLLSQQNERERLEQQLLAQMQATWGAYLAASEEHANIEDEFSNRLDHPDGVHAVNEASEKKRVALENHARVVRAFTDLTVRGLRPIPPGDPNRLFSINVGEWLQRPDGYWVLRIPGGE
jgi:hypothetical protein